MRLISLTIVLSIGNVMQGWSQPLVAHQFRGVWVATVANIDWPSQSSLSIAEQQAEFIELLEMHKKNGMNAILLQVRPAADAFYYSRLEPWSQWLINDSSSLHYDPLQFCIKEAHARGIELHAWFNPFRAQVNYTDSLKSNVNSIASKHPEWTVIYGKNKYLNPGIPEARKHTLNVVMDVVNRYDIDGVHFDDYFYPYKIEGSAFPDSLTFAEHGNHFQSRDDWRRTNIDLLIQTLHDSIKQVKPYVSFGVSPFGVWRNNDKDSDGSATRAGQTCYDDLYADVRKWMREGWIDYVAPQLYLPIGHERVAFETMIEWWCRNSFGVPIYIGQAAYRVNGATQDARWKKPSELFNQFRLCQTCPAIKGNIYFSSKSFKSNPLGINDTLRTNIYRKPSLTPNRKIFVGEPDSIQVNVSYLRGKLTLSWPQVDSLNPAVPFVIHQYSRHKNRKDTATFFVDTNMFINPKLKKKRTYCYRVEAMDRYVNVAAVGKTGVWRRKGKKLVVE
jgi:uncharacterized lipoprotein YddW (UPF0748 family)